MDFPSTGKWHRIGYRNANPGLLDLPQAFSSLSTISFCLTKTLCSKCLSSFPQTYFWFASVSQADLSLFYGYFLPAPDHVFSCALGFTPGILSCLSSFVEPHHEQPVSVSKTEISPLRRPFPGGLVHVLVSAISSPTYTRTSASAIPLRVMSPSTVSLISPSFRSRVHFVFLGSVPLLIC